MSSWSTKNILFGPLDRAEITSSLVRSLEAKKHILKPIFKHFWKLQRVTQLRPRKGPNRKTFPRDESFKMIRRIVFCTLGTFWGRFGAGRSHFWAIYNQRATSQAPKRQARRGSQLVLMNLLTFLFQHLSSDLEYFYLEAAGLQKDRRGL